jgi:hypothetical protein
MYARHRRCVLPGHEATLFAAETDTICYINTSCHYVPLVNLSLLDVCGSLLGQQVLLCQYKSEQYKHF